MTQPNRVPVLPRRYFPVDTAADSGGTFKALELASETSSPDAWMIETCGDLIEVEGQLDKLFERKKTTAAQKRQMGALDDKAVSLRRRVIGNRATTLAGHCAHALAFLAMDRGRLLAAANARDTFEGRMLAALICDLLEMRRRLSAGDQEQANGETMGFSAAGQQTRDLETAIVAAIAHARELGEYKVAEDLTVSLELAKSRR